jgi:hypothetical protein
VTPVTISADPWVWADGLKQVVLITFLAGAFKSALAGLVLILRPQSDETWLNDHFGKVCAVLVGILVGWLDASALGISFYTGAIGGLVNAAIAAGVYWTGIPSTVVRAAYSMTPRGIAQHRKMRHEVRRLQEQKMRQPRDNLEIRTTTDSVASPGYQPDA